MMSSPALTTTKTAPVAEGTSGDWAPLDQWQLTILVRLEERGPIVAQEVVTSHDFDDVLSELCFHAFWRRGAPGYSQTQMHVECSPQFLPDKPAKRLVGGYQLRTTTPRGDSYSRTFSVLSLQWAARRAALRLISEGRLQADGAYIYHLRADRGSPEAEVAATAAPTTESSPLSMTVVQKDPPLRWLRAALPPLLARSESVGAYAPEWSHVFYTRAAHVQAERLSRQGAKNVPAVETGAALLGTLCCCPDTEDMFAIITHALEVFDAESTEFSLEYSSRSWQRIQTVIEAARQQPQTATQRLLGQAHGHNFMPAKGAPPCELCAKAPVCGRTSVFVSAEDLNWTRAVFHRQPYALSHIFGLTARHLNPHPDEVHSLFGFCDGRLLKRAYHMIEDFDPSGLERGTTSEEASRPQLAH